MPSNASSAPVRSRARSCRAKAPGVYHGYSEAIYADEYDRSSRYIEMRDGTKIAIDICRPIDKQTGEVVATPLPVVWVSSTATDGDFVATLQDVAPDGMITSYNASGQLRASLRKLAEPPYDRLGFPYHRFMTADAMPLVPGEATELSFEILPISMIFKEGHRIQLVISFVTRGTPKFNPPPGITVYRDANHASYLTLPIID